MTSQTDQHGNVTTYVYAAADRLTSVTDALGNTTSYVYDEVSDLISITDANGNITKYSYDDLSRLTKVTNALGKTAEMTYDECGNVLTSTDFAGKLTSYTYDEFDRLASKTTDDGTVTYSYTVDGKLSSVKDSTGTTKYTYDSMDGLKKVVYPNGEYVEYTYDDSCRLTSVKTAYGTTSYGYDKLDRLVRVVDRNGYATVYEYDENGNRSAVKYANGIVISYKYDEVNRLISEKALDKQGGLVAQYEYTLGAAGERTKVKELDRTVEYTYDALLGGYAAQVRAIEGAIKNKQWDQVITQTFHLTLSILALSDNCFTGETLVATEDGQKRIDEIEVGDKVWAYDIYTGETELKEVLTVYVHDVDEILHLHTTCGDIDTTTNHPFYVIDKGWIAAGDLNNGDEVYLIDGSTAFVTGEELEKLTEPIKVYNLEVADFNTYFVGDVPVLVHNYEKAYKDKYGNWTNGTYKIDEKKWKNM